MADRPKLFSGNYIKSATWRRKVKCEVGLHSYDSSSDHIKEDLAAEI